MARVLRFPEPLRLPPPPQPQRVINVDSDELAATLYRIETAVKRIENTVERVMRKYER